jgi:DMSO reductase anchor subunit
MRSAGWISLAGWGLLQMGLAASVFHLGRPLGAWRAFLGWRTSWMSREIMVFGAFAALATLATIAANWPWLEERIPFLGWVGGWTRPFLWSSALMLVTAFAGMAGVFCSAMIYIDTRRVFWRADLSFGKFFGNAAWMGAALAAVLLAWIFRNGEMLLAAPAQTLGWSAAGIGLVLLLWEKAVWVRAFRDEGNEWHESARVMGGLLGHWLAVRFLCFLGAIGLMVGGCLLGGMSGAWTMTGAVVLAGAGQWLERYFYFVAVRAPRMPGTPA